MALHPSVYLGNLLLFAFSNFKASAEHRSSIEYPSDTPLNYSNFNASQILQYLIDKHLKLNCANLNGSFDSKNSTDPETTQLNHNSEEYHRRMKRCSEWERHNKILQQFEGRKQKENVSTQARKADKPHVKKNPYSTTRENYSDLDHDEGRGDMAHALHSSTDILATNSVTEPQPLNVYTLEEKDGKILAEKIQQQFNTYQHGFEVSSEFPTSTMDKLRDQSTKTDKLPKKPPSLLNRIRTVMEGGSLKDKSSNTDASTYQTNKYDNSSSTTPLISHNPKISKNVFELITNSMSGWGNSARDSSSSAPEGKSSGNASFMIGLDSVTNGVKNVEQKSKENEEKIQVKDVNQNAFYDDPTTISSLRSSSGSQVTTDRSTFSSSQKRDSPISETKLIKKKNERSSQPQLSTRSTSTSHLKKQTSEKITKNDPPTRAQTSISTQVPKSTPSLIKHEHPSVIPQMKISSKNENKHHHLESHSTLQDLNTKVDKEDLYLRSDNHRTDIPFVQTEALPSMEYHTPIPISSINRLHHWQHHSTQKGKKSKTDQESQLPPDHEFTDLPLLNTEMQQDKETQKAIFVPITTQNQSQPALMTFPDAHKAISRLSIAFSSTAQNTHTNGKHNHNFHTTPVQFTAITASSPNQIDLITKPQILQRFEPDENEILELSNAQFNHMIPLKLKSLHHPKIPVYSTTTTQIPSLDQSMPYHPFNYSPIPTSTTTSQNENIMSSSQEIINLEKKIAQLMNEHQKYLESLTKDKANNPLHKNISEMKHSSQHDHQANLTYGTVTTQIPLLEETVNLSNSSNPHKPTHNYIAIQRNEEITKVSEEVISEKEKREELINLHKKYLKSLPGNHQKPTTITLSNGKSVETHETHKGHALNHTTSSSQINAEHRYNQEIPFHRTTAQVPLVDESMPYSTSSNPYKSTTPKLIQPNEDITKILQEMMMLEKESREELINLHKKYLESLQKSHHEKLPPKIMSDVDTFIEHEIHDDHTLYDTDAPSHINIRPSHRHDILSHSTTTTQAPLSDGRMDDSTFSNSHKSTTPTLTQPNDDITKILEEITILKNKKREELINLSKNYHKSLPINDLDKPSNKIAADSEPSTKHKGHKDHTLDNPISPLPIDVAPHHQLDSLSITQVSFLDKELSHSNITSQDEDIAKILENIKKLEKEKREELIRIHKEYLESLKNKAHKSGGNESQSQSELEYPSNHQLNQDHSSVCRVSLISKVTLPSHKIPRQHKFSSHNHQSTQKLGGSVGELKNKHPLGISSTTVENGRASPENEENIVQKPRLPQPPLNPNENWRFSATLDEFYEKQKNRTTPTPRRTRPTLSIPTTTKPTPTSPSRMRTTTEYNPIPRVSTSRTNRLPYSTTAPTTTTDRSKSKGYSLNSTITRNYNITINLSPPQDSNSSSENDDLSIDPSSYSSYLVPDDIRTQPSISPDEFIGMSSSIPTNKSSQHSISADEYTDVPYAVYQTPMDVEIPPPPPPPYLPPPYLTYPSPVLSTVQLGNPPYVLPYPPYSSLVPVQPYQFNGPFPIPLPQTSNDRFSTNDAPLENPNPHFQKSSETDAIQQEDPKNEESGNFMTEPHSFNPTTDTRETTEQTQTPCPGENCTKKECNNVYVIQDRSADMVNIILRFLNIASPKNVTESTEPAILQSYLRANSMTDNTNLHSDTLSNMENMLNSIRGSTSIGSDKVQLRQSINDLLASLKQRRDQEYGNLYATRLNPNVGYGRDNVVAIMKINEYIELLELMLVYLARDPDKLLDESKDARISNDESPYPPDDPQRRLIEDQFYFVHPKILNEFIDVYKRYSKGDGYFGKPAWHYSQENGARSASRHDSLGKSLNQLFHLQGLLPELIYDRSDMYRPGISYIS